MAIVPLDFIPPTDPDIVKLHIEEAVDSAGPFTVIETVTEVGAYPNYITRWTTDQADSISNWFRIRWENAKGAMSPFSESVKGGTTTLVQQIIDRVMLRDPLANENIAQQEAEAVIEDVFYTDPYLVDPTTVTAKQKSGITFLTLARVYLSSIVTSISSGAVQTYTAGLVSQSAGSQAQSQVSQGMSNIEQLVKWANHDLGLNYSIIMLLKQIDVAGEFWMTNEWTIEALTQ